MQIRAPPGFVPQDVKAEAWQPPGPVRSRYRKFDIYRDAQQFTHVDNHAIQVSQVDHDNFTDLIYHLVYERNFSSDLDKTRAIFRWMTSKNMYTIQFRGNVKPGSPEEVILSFRNKQGTYARIFETLCRFSGVHAVVLTGFAKGLDYRPGDKFKGNDYNHSWNAVLIDGNWYLVDSHWATRYLVSEKNQPENLVYEYDDFYFLTDPEQLIYSHWAHRSEWQLLPRAISLDDYQNLPLVKSYFFKCGMFFVSHHTGVVETKKGRIAITLGFCKPTNFTYKIVMADSNEEIHQGQKLKSFALQHQGQNQTTTFVFRAPKPGPYYFTVFAQLLTGELGVKNVFTASAEYKVIADQPATDSGPLPQCSDSSWGPGVAVDQLGLVPNPREGILTTDGGKVEIEFKKTRPAQVLCKLRKNGMREEDLERCISEEDQGDRVVVSTQLPQHGEYGIEVYGNDPAKDGDTYTHICQYFVHFDSPDAQGRAFYQESPERRSLGPEGKPSTTQAAGYQPDMAGLDSKTAQMNLGDMDDLPPPPPELLQQQYLYGTVPDSRQTAVPTNYAFPQSHAQATYTPGTNKPVVLEPAQSGKVSNIPPPETSKPLQVEKRSMGQSPPAPPPNFRLVPVKQEREQGPPPVAPKPQAPKPNLEAIDRQVLESVDDHAIQVSKSEHNSFSDLVWDLIYSKNITNEIEKVRVIFRWLATKNLKEMNFDHVEKGSPEEVLMGLKTGKTTYAMVFDTICNYAGLHSKIITGFAKGADYEPGQRFAPGSNQHSWNAVYIYGTWCLIDAHWAARRIIGKQASSEEFHYQLDEYFFLPDPHQLIYTHFPEEPQWQLLERPITLEEFENMPHMKPLFFKYGLEFVTHRTAVIYARGEVHIRLRYPSHKLAVLFNVSIQTISREEDYHGIKLSRYCMQESVGGIASFHVRLPQRGSYMLYIYGKEDTPDCKEQVYAQVCEYKIEQEEVSSPPPEPFPPCSYLSWGPGSAFYRYGLTTYQQSATIHTRDGKAELQVRLPKASIQFLAKLKAEGVDEGELEGYVVHRTVGNTAFFTISAPHKGEFGLELYANDRSSEGITLYHVAQFLVRCDQDVKTPPLPKLQPGYLGAQPKFSEYGLMTHSHHDPIIHLECNTVTIQMKSERPMRVTANLISADSDQEFPDYVFSHVKGSVITFIVNLTTTGFFKVQLYAAPMADKSEKLLGVYNYLVNCQKITQNVMKFPKQYAQWKEGCYMFEPGVIPTCGQAGFQHLTPQQLPPTVNFHVAVPQAEAVAVACNSQWTHLDQGPGDEWTGVVEMADHYGQNVRVTLNANYGGDKSSYVTLLEYTV